MSYGMYYEEFVPGQVIEHDLRKTITESDNNMFCLLTMNHHPVHCDIEYAKTHQHGRILVVGTLVFSLAVGITVQDISGHAVANLEYLNVKHLAPVFLNDTIHVSSEILARRESRTKPDRGIVHVLSRVFSQNGQEVLSFERKVLVFKKG
ncbi:MAG: MaoC family dehydratase [Synergistaceae bacterium]|nr:MaoC family dehydratase [Synergistaceae bacterium]